MKKNVASQVIGVQMVSASDGSAFTSAVTVAVTGDAGTQATGSVGSGACTHEGNGFHTYAPAQAETNYDHVAFTFTGTGAVPATVQVYTTFPQTGDGFARLGAPAGASVSADVAAVKVDTAAILVDTGTTLDARIPAALVGGRMDASVGAMAANVMTAAAAAADLTTELQSGLATAAALDAVDNFLDTEIAAIKAVTDLLPDAGALTSLATQASVNTIDDFLDTEIAALTTAVADLPTNAELSTALGTADDAVLAAIAALNNLSAAQVNAEVVDALATDTYAEPGQGTPAATAALSAKIGYLYKAWRNRSTQTASEYALYADDGTTKDQEAACSDDATTFVRGEVATGA